MAAGKGELVLDTEDSVNAVGEDAHKHWNLSEPLRIKKIAFKECNIPMTFSNGGYVEVIVVGLASQGDIWVIRNLTGYIDVNYFRAVLASITNEVMQELANKSLTSVFSMELEETERKVKISYSAEAGEMALIVIDNPDGLLGENVQYQMTAMTPSHMSIPLTLGPRALDLCSTSLSLRHNSSLLAGQQRVILQRIYLDTMEWDDSRMVIRQLGPGVPNLTPFRNYSAYTKKHVVAEEVNLLEHDAQQPLRLIGLYWSDTKGRKINFNGEHWTVKLQYELEEN